MRWCCAIGVAATDVAMTRTLVASLDDVGSPIPTLCNVATHRYLFNNNLTTLPINLFSDLWSLKYL